MRPIPILGLALAFAMAASCGSARPRSPLGGRGVGPPAPRAALVDAREKLVRSFNAAFNAQDATAMAALVTSDVQWLAVRGQTVTIETRSKEELLRSMLAYFKTCPPCRSRLAQVIVARTRVSVLEVATWTTSAGKKETQGFVVYE